MNPELALIIAAIALILTAIQTHFDRSKNGGSQRLTPDQMSRIIEHYQESQSSLITQYEERIRQQELIVNKLREENAALRTQNQPTLGIVTSSSFPQPDLLVVFGPDPEIVKADRGALNRAKIDFERILNATIDDVAERIRSRRIDGEMFKYLHISSHGSDDGVVLTSASGAEEMVPPAWWMEQTAGVKTVMISTCRGTKLAAELLGVVDHVVFFREGVVSTDAADFAEVFWGEHVCGRSVPEAFQLAREAVPAVREFVTLRTARGLGRRRSDSES